MNKFLINTIMYFLLVICVLFGFISYCFLNLDLSYSDLLLILDGTRDISCDFNFAGGFVFCLLLVFFMGYLSEILSLVSWKKFFKKDSIIENSDSPT